MVNILTLKMKLYPTKEQEQLFKMFSGTNRFVYNYMLSFRKSTYKRDKKILTLQEQLKEIQRIKHETEEYTWIKNIPEAVTKQSVKDLDTAYKRFFKGLSKFPKYKSKRKTKETFYQRTDSLRYWEETSTVTITGVGRVRVNNHYGRFPTKPQNPRVSFDGKYWYLTIGEKVEPIKTDLTDVSLGIDLGIAKLLVRSDNVEVKNINKTKRIRNLEKKLKRKQRALSKKYIKNQKNGNRNSYEKTQNILKVEKQIRELHRKLTNIRKNHLHNATKDIVKTKPYRVVVEDLNISGMLKNKYLSKAIQQQGWNTFIAYLTYKCEIWGIQVVKANRYFPSSKLCSKCGHKKKALSLSERLYDCESCGNLLDRDYNASLNLAKYIV